MLRALALKVEGLSRWRLPSVLSRGLVGSSSQPTAGNARSVWSTQVWHTPNPCCLVSRTDPANATNAQPLCAWGWADLPALVQPFLGNVRPGEGSGKDLEVSGLNVWPFVRSKSSEPWAPAPPPPPRLPGASVSRGEAERTPTHRLRGAPGPPPAGPDPADSAARSPSPSPCRRRRRCRCRCAESARSPPAGSGGTDRSRGSWRAPGAPRLPPGQGRGGAQGATRRVGAAAGPRLPRRSQSPGSTPRRPPPLSSRRRRHRGRRRRPGSPSPPPAARRRAESPGHTHGERRTLAAPRSGWNSNMASAFAAPPPPLTPAPPASSPCSRLRRDCAAAIPARALPGLARARPVRAPALRGGAAVAGGRDVPDLSRCGQSSEARKGLPAPGTAGGTGRKCSLLWFP